MENYCHLINVTMALLHYTSNNIQDIIPCINQTTTEICENISHIFTDINITHPKYAEVIIMLYVSLNNTLNCIATPFLIKTPNLDTNNTIVYPNNTIIDTNNTIVDTNNTIVYPNNTIIDTNNTIINTNNTIVHTNTTIVDTNNTIVDTNNTIVDTNNTLDIINTIVDTNNTVVYTNNTIDSNNTIGDPNNLTNNNLRIVTHLRHVMNSTNDNIKIINTYIIQLTFIHWLIIFITMMLIFYCVRIRCKKNNRRYSDFIPTKNNVSYGKKRISYIPTTLINSVSTFLRRRKISQQVHLNKML